MSFKRFWLAIVFFLCLAAGNQLIATAQTPTIAFTLAPAILKLAPGEQAQALVTLTNPLTTTLQDMSLTWFSDAGVDVAIKPPMRNTLAPQATAA